ncbi:MAG: methyltransferase domain-containing protein [Pirellulales bacterium]|nr:methyltransferase domain-containing protein [Pirellulales bacterium]
MHDACPACGYRILHPVYRSEPQPLAALNLPRSREAAREALRYPMDFQACGFCGHVFNRQFDYYQVPYEDDSNLMYNRGRGWQGHLDQLIDVLVEGYDVAGKTLVDIGCGDGLFLKRLLDRDLGCRCIGFEPGVEAHNARRNGLTVHKDYFHAQRDLQRIRPDVVVCRHVIEHLSRPRELVESIAYWGNRYELFPLFVAEVPRIEKAIQQGRVSDFLYEHVSNFTDFSLKNMFETAGYEVLEQEPCYDGEVIVLIGRPKRLPRIETTWRASEGFRRRVDAQHARVTEQLAALRQAGRSVAFWGGTGKGAAFLNAFGVDAETFPVVVDSDEQKVGRFVPGTGQEIRPPDWLRQNPVDVIVITTRWRARDIFDEIQRRGIACREVLVLASNELQPYEGDESGWLNPKNTRIDGQHPGGLNRGPAKSLRRLA